MGSAGVLPVFGEIVQETTMSNENNFLFGTIFQPTARSTGSLGQGLVSGRISSFLFDKSTVHNDSSWMPKLRTAQVIDIPCYSNPRVSRLGQRVLRRTPSPERLVRYQYHTAHPRPLGCPAEQSASYLDEIAGRAGSSRGLCILSVEVGMQRLI